MQVDWSQLHCEDPRQAALLLRGCYCYRDGLACPPIQECCRGVRHQGGQMVNPVDLVHLDVVLQLAAGVSRCVDHRALRVGEPLVLGEHLFQVASVEGDPPVPVWPVSAGLEPFGSQAIWAGVDLEVEELGAHLLRLVPDGSAPCCGVWLLLRVRAHWVWPAVRLACWRCDLALGQQRV